MKLPQTKDKGIVLQKLGNELLIYKLSDNQGFSLNQTLTQVYEACALGMTVEQLEKENGFTKDLIYLSIDELKREELIEANTHNHFAGLNRREVIKKVGLSTMLALPVLLSVTAPKASQAASGVCELDVNLQCFCPEGSNQTCGRGADTQSLSNVCAPSCVCTMRGTGICDRNDPNSLPFEFPFGSGIYHCNSQCAMP